MAKKQVKKKAHDTSHKHHESNKDHKEHHALHRKAKRSFPWKAVVGFVILVAIVYGVIVLFSKVERDDDVAAYVNGEAITLAYLDEQYSRIPLEYQAFITKDVLLNQTINEKILLQEADSKGITVSSSEVKQAIDEAMLVAGLTEDEMIERLAEQDLNVEFLEDLYHKQMIINELLESEVFNNIRVSNKEVQDEYDSNIHAAHILVESESDAQSIIYLLDNAANPVALFSDLALERSIDPSAEMNMGDLGEFKKGMMVPDFETAAFALGVGEYSKVPVQTQFGYHVILRLPRLQSFEQAGDEIYQYIFTMKKSDAVIPYVDALRNKAKIDIRYSE